jgi:phosphopantothenoylcysteine decarboxylase/phosphopantothenate--cysteine ligase
MNDTMYAHPATRQNLATLAGRGWRFVGPEVGPLAEGPSEQGLNESPNDCRPRAGLAVGPAETMVITA